MANAEASARSDRRRRSFDSDQPCGQRQRGGPFRPATRRSIEKRRHTRPTRRLGASSELRREGRSNRWDRWDRWAGARRRLPRAARPSPCTS